jgi:hypothetical protein
MRRRQKHRQLCSQHYLPETTYPLLQLLQELAEQTLHHLVDELDQDLLRHGQ